MALTALLTFGDDRPWIEEVLAAVLPFVERVVAVDLGSRDGTEGVVAARLDAWGGESNRLRAEPGSSPAEARGRALAPFLEGGSGRVLLLEGRHLYPPGTLSWCRRLLEEVELHDAQPDLPPRQHARHADPEVTDGVLVRHLALPALRPQAGDPASGRGEVLPPRVRFLTPAGLQVDGEGNLREPTGELLEESPYRLVLPTTSYQDFSEKPQP